MLLSPALRAINLATGTGTGFGKLLSFLRFSDGIFFFEVLRSYGFPFGGGFYPIRWMGFVGIFEAEKPKDQNVLKR